MSAASSHWTMGDSAAPVALRPALSRVYAQLPQRATSENRFWRMFRTVALEQLSGAPSTLHFSPTESAEVAVTSGSRIQIYDANTARVKRQISKFKDVAYSGTYRSDGKLMAAGGESCAVQVFELASKAVLRKLEGHRRPVHVAAFSPHKTHIMSASDDATIAWWDLPTGQRVTTFREHEDYVRCAVAVRATHSAWPLDRV